MVTSAVAEARIQQSTTADGPGALGAETHVRRTQWGGGTRADLAAAWTSSSQGWRLAAIVIALVALGSTVSAQVPFASGLATAVLVPAALVDLRERRLPNTVVGGAAATFIVVLSLEALVGAPVHPGNIVVGSAVMAGPLLLLHLVSPESMGFGDIKTAVVLGAAVGAVDWQLAVAALALAAGSSATAGLVSRARTIAFGPGLVAGTALALAAHTLLLPSTDTVGSDLAGWVIDGIAQGRHVA